MANGDGHADGLCKCIGCGRVLFDGSHSKVDKYVADIPQQTDGGRAIQQVSSIFKRLKSQPDAFCQPFIRWFYSEVEVLGRVQKTHEHLQQMVTLRNGDVHNRLKQSEMDLFIEGCVTLLKRCFALQEYTLFVVKEQDPIPTGVEGWISVFDGGEPFCSNVCILEWC